MSDDSGRLELPRGPRTGDSFVVEVTDIDVRKGRGLGELDVTVGPQKEPRVYSVLVRKGVPGDKVRIGVEGFKKSRLEARIDEFIEPSPMRIPARCQHYGQREVPGKGCGGCTLQALDYRHQLFVKEKMVKGLMHRAGVDPGLVYPVVPMDDPWFYRNKMEFSFGDDHERAFSLGLHPTGFKHDVLSLEQCLLLSEFGSDFLPKARAWFKALDIAPYHQRTSTGWLRTLTIREGKNTGERMIELTTSPGEGGPEDPESVVQAFADFIAETGAFTSVYWTQHHAQRGTRTWFEHKHLAGEETLREELNIGDVTLTFQIHPRAFFQPNTLGAQKLYAKVIQRADLSDATLLDLYCGTGTIGIAMAHAAKRVVGVEIVPDAVENARGNAQRNGADNVEFFCGDVGAILEQEGLKGDVVVLDPPRAGLLPNAHEHIDATGADRLVYVSCNPRALARDLVQLGERGWKTRSIEPVDMFPHTHHIENVVLLER